MEVPEQINIFKATWFLNSPKVALLMLVMKFILIAEYALILFYTCIRGNKSSQKIKK